MGENEHGGMLRVVVVLALIAFLGYIFTRAVISMSGKASSTTHDSVALVDKNKTDATNDLDESITDYYNPDPSHNINDSQLAFGYAINKSNNTAMLTNGNRTKTSSSFEIPSYVIQDGKKYTVTSIAGGTFAGYPVKSVIIPKTIKSIGDGAFNYSSLEQVTFKEGLESIGNASFMSTKLTSVKLPSTLKTTGQMAFDSNVVKN